jgi:hypothetical protein
MIFEGKEFLKDLSDEYNLGACVNITRELIPY